MGPPTDRAPVGARSADADRFRHVYDRHVRAVTAYFVRRVHPDRVEDAVSETFTVAWRRIGEVPNGDASLLWLYRVAQNVRNREYRASDRRRRLGIRLAGRRPPASAQPDDRLIDEEEGRRVLEAIDQLNDSDGEVLRLLAWEQLTPSEIATVLDIAPNAAHQRVHRAKRNLVRRFDQLDAATSTSTTSPARSTSPEGGIR